MNIGNTEMESFDVKAVPADTTTHKAMQPAKEISGQSTVEQSPQQKEDFIMQPVMGTIIPDSAVELHVSTITKKVAMLKDSTAKKMDSNLNNKAITKKKYNSAIKIEGGIISVVPIQAYKNPLYVKRIVHAPGFRSEFISDHVTSTVETGAGISISLVKKMNKKWSIGTGIQLLRFTEKLRLSGIEINTNYNIVQRVVDGASGPSLKPDTLSIITKTTTTLRGRNIYSNVSLPVFARFVLIEKKKWTGTLSAGMNINVIRKYENNLSGKFQTFYNNSNESGQLGDSKGIGFFRGFHFSGMLYKRYEWFAASSFTYDVTKYNTNNLSFNKQIQLAGISLGIGCQLKK